ncbi:MAG: threonine/serine dehydratase, partial [Roseiflexus castenholzii]
AVIAALQSGAVDATRYAAPVAVICGGNVDAGCVFEQYTAR